MIGPAIPIVAQVASDAGITIPVDDPRFLGALLITGGMLLLNMANGVLGIVKFFKADPPAHKTYASKKEIEEAEARLSKHIDEEAKKVVEVERRLNLRIDTDAGELKSVEQRLTQAHTASESRIQAHLASQDKFQGSLQGELKSIHNQLGELNGLLKARAGKL